MGGGGVGYPWDLDIQGCPLGKDFEHTWCPKHLTFRDKVILGEGGGLKFDIHELSGGGDFDSGFPKNVKFPRGSLPHPPGRCIIQHMVVFSFNSVHKILKCDHSSESFFAALSCSTVHYTICCGSNF